MWAVTQEAGERASLDPPNPDQFDVARGRPREVTDNKNRRRALVKPAPLGGSARAHPLPKLSGGNTPHPR
eukprot:7174709-Pyramimonas_sp.AAC.1